MTIYIHEIKRNIKKLYIWSGIIGGLIFLCLMIYPEMKGNMQDVIDLYANLGDFSAAFGMDQLNFGTVMGFYGIECGTMLGVGGAFFAALLGIEILAKEETFKTAEFLLTHPISRRRIVCEKLLSIFTIIIAFNIVCLIISMISFAIISESIIWKPFLLFHFAQIILHIEIASICFAVSAFIKRGGMGIGLGLAALLYFLNIFANISDSIEFIKYITPFQYADAAAIISTKAVDGVLLIIGIIVTLFSIAISFYQYEKKDISA